MPDIVVDPADIVHSQGGLLIVDSTTGSGTGNYDSFLRVQANGDETGYNTDVSGQLDNKDGVWTHSLLISSLQTVTYNGVTYYEIRLDLNEIQSGDKANISLDDLKLFVGPAAGGGAYPAFSGLTLKFDLSGSVALVDNENGSGTDDYQILIPTSMLTGGTHLTLYSDFSGSDDGFEEFRAQTADFVPQPDIGINKQTNGTDDECRDVIAGSTVTWTYTVENNGNVDLHNVVVTDDNGTPGANSPESDDDFNPDMVLGVDNVHNIGDVNNNDILETTETWLYTYTGPAIVGEYANVATVSGVYDDGTLTGQTVSGIEEDCYNGVTPTIAVTKLTNLTDDTCPYILVGEDVVWTYSVTNTSLGAITIDAITLTDDAGTDSDLLDDFSPAAVLDGLFNAGDDNTNNLLDPGETWQYTFTAPLGAVAGEYENTVTVNGTAHDTSGNTATVTGTADDCYFGAAPEIDIVKLTNGTDDVCPVVSVGSTVTWTYNVENTGNVALTNIDLVDDNGTPGGNDGPGGDPLDDDDFAPTAVLSGGFNVGDTANLGVFDPGEIWQYTATDVAEEGHYENTVTVTGDFTDDFQNSVTVDASDEDCYTGVTGPGVRTPGFWSNWTDFWDGDMSVPKQAEEDCFADYDLLRIDSNGDKTIDSNDTGFANGLYIGDYDRNGVADPDEDVIFISMTDALNLINASNKQMNDGVVKIGRDLVASWLNYLAGNPVGTVADDGMYSPMEAIDDAIDYLQIFGDLSNSNTNNPAEIFDTYSAGHRAIRTSTDFWNNDFPGGGVSGSDIHGALDEYNNFGTVDGTLYAHDCDEQQFLSQLNGFSLHGELIYC